MLRHPDASKKMLFSPQIERGWGEGAVLGSSESRRTAGPVTSSEVERERGKKYFNLSLLPPYLAGQNLTGNKVAWEIQSTEVSFWGVGTLTRGK